MNDSGYLMQYYSYEATSLSGSSGPHYLAVATAKVNSHPAILLLL